MCPPVKPSSLFSIGAICGLFQRRRGNVISRQLPAPSVFHQRECLHGIAAIKRSLISHEHRMCRSGLFLVYTLKIAPMNFAKLLSQCCERCSRLIERRRSPPFIRGFAIKLFVASGVDICDGRVERGLSARWHAVAARALAASPAENQEKNCKVRERLAASPPHSAVRLGLTGSQSREI